MRPGCLAARPERAAALDVGRVDHLAVASDVAALAPTTRRTRSSSPPFDTRRGVVERTWSMPAGPDQAHLTADLDARRPRVDEVQLVLLVVVVEEPVEVRRHHDALTPNASTPSACRTLRKP